MPLWITRKPIHSSLHLFIGQVVFGHYAASGIAYQGIAQPAGIAQGPHSAATIFHISMHKRKAVRFAILITEVDDRVLRSQVNPHAAVAREPDIAAAVFVQVHHTVANFGGIVGPDESIVVLELVGWVFPSDQTIGTRTQPYPATFIYHDIP